MNCIHDKNEQDHCEECQANIQIELVKVISDLLETCVPDVEHQKEGNRAIFNACQAIGQAKVRV